jgi:hypothetical protein
MVVKKKFVKLLRVKVMVLVKIGEAEEKLSFSLSHLSLILSLKMIDRRILTVTVFVLFQKRL